MEHITDKGVEKETQDLNKTNISKIIQPTEKIFPLERIEFGDSSAQVSYERGGSITSLTLNGVELFYNDPDLRNNPHKNLREGFWMGPISGNLSKEDQKLFNFNLQQHGFLRNMKRNLIKNQDKGHLLSKLRHSPTDPIFNDFPHHFETTQIIELANKLAYICLEIKNLGEKSMPFAPGHHTYYQVDPTKKEDITLKGIDNLSDEDKLAWINGEKAIRIKNPGNITLHIPGKPPIELFYSEEFKELRLWSEKGKGFVCVEPVVTHGSGFIENALQIQPGETKRLFFTISTNQ